MKNLFFIIIVTAAVAFFGTPMTAVAQSVANYTPTRTTGNTYNSILSTGNAVSAWRTTDIGDNSYYDDNRSYPVLIGFDFWYDGKRYTQFSVSTNGFMDFDASSWNGGSGSAQANNPYGPYSTDFVRPNRTTPDNGGTVTALAPFYYDLTTNQTLVPLGNSIKYQLDGTAPSRILTVEWNNMGAWTDQNDTLNFQVKLHESTGVIEYCYGYMNGTITTNPNITGFGYVTGINAPSISSNPPTAAQLLCLQTANTNTFSNGQQNQLSAMPQSYSKYTFTPPIPSSTPSGISFASVAPASMILNWTDNATNEVGYAIYSSLDGSNYTYTTQVAASSISYTATGLNPGTTYYWKVYAVTEGGLSASLNGSQVTNPATDYTSAQTGNWNTNSTWVGNAVPAANANVIIANTHTVTIDGDITVNNITVATGGTLQIGNDATAHTLNVLGNITVNAGAEFKVNTASNPVTYHQLNLTGNIVNNNIFNLATDADSRCQITFNRAGNQTISGTGATTYFYLMTLNMGTSNNNVLDITSSHFSTQSTGFLTITNGTFKYGVPSSTVTPFTANTTVPLTGGLWVNNSSAVVTTTGGNFSVQGFVKVTSGVLNVGSAANQQLSSNGGTFIIDGGAVNVAGCFTSTSLYAITNFTISGGTFTVATFGSTLASQAPFMVSVAGSTFNQSGGTIVIRNAGAGNLGYVNTNTSSSSVLGGTLQIGDGSTPTATIQINSTIPVYNLTNSSANATAQLMTNNLTVNNDVLIAAGTLNANNIDMNVQGNWTNHGTFTPGTGTVTFSGSANSTITTGETFNNLTFSGSGTKSFAAAAIINGTLSISGTAVANLGTFTSTSNALALGGSGQVSGTWGGTSSGAPHINSTYFATATGILSVTTYLNLYTWTGATNTDWNVTSNWISGSVPSSSTDVVISSGSNQPVIGAAAFCKNITINSGATLTITGSNTLTVSGNWAISGNLNGGTTSGSGTVTIAGTATQSIGSLTTTSAITFSKTSGAVNITGNVSAASFTMSTEPTGDASVTLNTGVSMTLTGALALNLPASSGRSTFNINGATVSCASVTLGGTTGGIFTTINISTGTLSVTGNITSAGIDSRIIFSGAGALNVGGTFTAGTFTASTGTVNFNGSGSQTVGGVTYNNLTMSGGGTKSLGGAATVNGVLTLTNGTFTNSSNLTLGNGATISRSGGSLSAAPTFGATTNVTYTAPTTPASITTGYELPTSGLNNLTINNSSGVTLNAAATVNGTLTMSAGNIALGGNTLTLGTAAGSPGTLTYTAGYLTGTGTFTRWFGTSLITLGNVSGRFPMGVSTNNRNLWIGGTPTTGGTVSVQYTDATTESAISFTENSNPFVNRYDASWTVATANSFAGNSLSLQIQGSGIPGISNIVDLTISGPAAAAAGSPLATSGTSSDPVISRNGLTQATLASTLFYIASTSSSALPVEMTSFTAVLQGTSALLKWSTATEVNNNGFEIQRRAEGTTSWAKVGFASGAGTSNAPKAYSYEDKNLAPGVYVYRIKQIDNNGAFKYSASTQVDAGVSTTLQLCGNYPNPFNPTTNIQFSVPQDGYASLKIYNILGQEVATLFSGIAKTGHYIPATFNASRLASGIYFARLQYSGKSLVQRMLMTK